MSDVERPSRPSQSSLSLDPMILEELKLGFPRTQNDTGTVAHMDGQQQTPIERARATEGLGDTALQAGNYAQARQHYGRAIAALQGQVPDVEPMPLMNNYVRARLERNVAPEHALPGANETQLRAAFPILQRLVDVGNANAAVIDARHRAIRPENLMNLAFAQTALRDYANAASNYLRAIELLETNPGNSLYINQLLRSSLNNYVFCLQEQPQTNERMLEVQRRIRQIQALPAR